MSFNVFRFPVSFFVWDCKDTVRCWRTGAASCRAAATELFGRKNLEKSTLAGPCFSVPKSAENRLRSKVPPEYHPVLKEMEVNARLLEESRLAAL